MAATVEQWTQVLEEWHSKPGMEDSSNIERVVTLTSVEFGCLSQLITIGETINGFNRERDKNVDNLKLVLAKKYGYEEAYWESRDVFWPLDGKIAIFVKGYLECKPRERGEQ